jgi:hypothetical protein
MLPGSRPAPITCTKTTQRTARAASKSGALPIVFHSLGPDPDLGVGKPPFEMVRPEWPFVGWASLTVTQP